MASASVHHGKVTVPDAPIIPSSRRWHGAGHLRASRRVFDAAVERAWRKRRVAWMEVFAGEKRTRTTATGSPGDGRCVAGVSRLDQGTVDRSGGGGIRSSTLRFVRAWICTRHRPVRYFEGVGAPVKERRRVNVVIFRENTKTSTRASSGRRARRKRSACAGSWLTTWARMWREGSRLCISPCGFRLEASRRDGHPIRAPNRARVGGRSCQGQHHEFNRGRISRLGI